MMEVNFTHLIFGVAFAEQKIPEELFVENGRDVGEGLVEGNDLASCCCCCCCCFLLLVTNIVYALMHRRCHFTNKELNFTLAYKQISY